MMGVYYFMDVAAAKVNRTDGIVDQFLWHRKMGHPAFSIFSFLPKFPGVLNSAIRVIATCVLGLNKEDMLF